MHAPAFSKTHFLLTRMDIDIHQRRINLQIEQVGRKAAMKEHIPVSMSGSVREGFVTHVTAINIKILAIGIGPIVGRLGDPTRESKPGN